MNSIRLLGTLARRTLLVSLLLFLALGFTPRLSDAGKPVKTANTTLAAGPGPCDFTVTYTWSGFSGHGLTAQVRLVEVTGTQLDIGFTFNQSSAVGKSGSYSHTFTLTGTNTANIRGGGELLNAKLTQVAGSNATSTNTIGTTCR